MTLRILTVRNPWGWALLHGGKNVENRPRNIAGDYRGPIAIHSGLAVFEEEGGAYPEVVRAIESESQGYRVDDRYLWEVADDANPDDPRFIYGAILGVVDLTDVHRGHNTEQDPFRAVRSCYQPGKPFGPCSPWAEPDAWHIELSNPRPLSEPIPFKGALGLRRLDADTVAAIEAQLT